MQEVAGYYGDLLKFSSYLLGHLDGKDIQLADVTAVTEPLRGHWFKPYFERLHEALRALWGQFGRWDDFALFEVIGTIIIDLLADIGMTFYETHDGGFGFNVPYTRDTMPTGFGWLAGFRPRQT